MKKKILIFYFIIVGILLGIIFIGVDRKRTIGSVITENKDIILSKDVFEYGEGYISIPIKKYIENEEDFYMVEVSPVSIGYKDIGVHEIKFTVSPKDKKDEYTIIKTIEIRDTQPPKIYLNRSWVESDYCGQMLASVMDPVDGLLDYKSSMSDSDRNCYTVYQENDKRIIRAIDKNGNVSELSIDNYSGDVQSNNNIIEVTDNQNEDCVLDKGFDNIYYSTQEQAIEAAREYFNLYQSQENAPKSFNVYVTSCGDTHYYIWDFMW